MNALGEQGQHFEVHQGATEEQSTLLYQPSPCRHGGRVEYGIGSKWPELPSAGGGDVKGVLSEVRIATSKQHFVCKLKEV